MHWQREFPNLQYVHEAYSQPKQNEVQELISAFASNDFYTREAASIRMRSLGIHALEELKKAALKNTDAEVRFRAEQALDELDQMPVSYDHYSILSTLKRKGRNYYLKAESDARGHDVPIECVYYSTWTDNYAATLFIYDLKLLGFTDASIAKTVKAVIDPTDYYNIQDETFPTVFPEALGGDYGSYMLLPRILVQRAQQGIKGLALQLNIVRVP